MAAKYELKTTPKGKFMFNLKAGNNEVILTSEMYESRDGALNGIESVRKNGSDPANFATKKAKDGQTYFVVMSAANKQVIGKSEMYKDEAGAKRGIASVVKNSGAPTVEAAAPKAKAAGKK